MLTGTWQEYRVVFAHADEIPAAPAGHDVALTESTVRTNLSGQIGTERPCPRLLHLDATLIGTQIAARRVSRSATIEMVKFLVPEEYARDLATPPPST
ncbi:hypothetical protein [Breoghania sp.]|uniref:hypothetical protein n=1 Tax=Breoghania sp. TaxID=2065378 RepID=UPI00260CAC58|nr:hypothetical protein [Breoghania sp.]